MYFKKKIINRNFLFLNFLNKENLPLLYYTKKSKLPAKRKIFYLENFFFFAELLERLFKFNFSVKIKFLKPSTKNKDFLKHLFFMTFSSQYFSMHNIAFVFSYYCFISHNNIFYLFAYLLNVQDKSIYKDQRALVRQIFLLVRCTKPDLLEKSGVAGFRFKIKGKFCGRPGDRRRVYYFKCEKYSVANCWSFYEIHYLQPKNANGATGWTVTILYKKQKLKKTHRIQHSLLNFNTYLILLFVFYYFIMLVFLFLILKKTSTKDEVFFLKKSIKYNNIKKLIFLLISIVAGLPPFSFFFLKFFSFFILFGVSFSAFSVLFFMYNTFFFIFYYNNFYIFSTNFKKERYFSQDSFFFFCFLSFFFFFNIFSFFFINALIV